MIQTGASRDTLDLTHLVFNAGNVGRLKGMSWTPVVAGDSIEIDAVGAIRLSPLRRGLAIDSCVDFFTFYIPYRHIYGDAWINLMKSGVSGTPLPSVPSSPRTNATGYLGVTAAKGNHIPKFLHQGYLNIYNNYFKAPWMPDRAEANPSDLAELDSRLGFRCCHLKSIWTAPLPPATQTSKNMTTGATTLDIMGLKAQYAQLQTEQERLFFMSRYRDIVKSFGGSTYYDADMRPLLLMRSNFWASGYDIDGTDQVSLGQFSGRVQQPFKHSVPRFYVPEHGFVFTLALLRFPPTCTEETHYLVGKPQLGYSDIAADPAIVANLPPREIAMDTLFRGFAGKPDIKIKVAKCIG